MYVGNVCICNAYQGLIQGVDGVTSQLQYSQNLLVPILYMLVKSNTSAVLMWLNATTKRVMKSGHKTTHKNTTCLSTWQVHLLLRWQDGG